MEFLATHSPGRALDLGCGTGTNVITLARKGWQATGVDFAWSAIRMARRKAMQARVDVDLRVEDVTRLRGLADRYDLILDIGCFHNLSADCHAAYIDNVERLLDSQGTYLLYAFIKQGADERGPGIAEADIESLSARLRLVSRKNGTERGIRPSAWMTFDKGRNNE